MKKYEKLVDVTYGIPLMWVTDRGRVKPRLQQEQQTDAHAQHALLLNRPITHLWRQATLIDETGEACKTTG